MSATTRRPKRQRSSSSGSSGNGGRFDAYRVITDQVVAMLEAGTAPWHKPWRTASGVAGLPLSLSTGKPYRGVNAFLLQMATAAQGYGSPWWATYDKIQERGGQVRRGEKSTLIVFWKQYATEGENGEPDRMAFVLRAYRVFNLDQANGVPGSSPAEGPATDSDFDPIQACEAAIAGYVATGPRVVYGGNHATYTPATDVIHLPDREAFTSPEHYYGTKFHELTHSTGHRDRLARPDLLTFHHFGDPSYSREELVAEMGAAFLAGVTGIDAVTLSSSADYLASWVRVLKGDSRLVVRAAAQAQKAADLILGVTFDNA